MKQNSENPKLIKSHTDDGLLLYKLGLRQYFEECIAHDPNIEKNRKYTVSAVKELLTCNRIRHKFSEASRRSIVVGALLMLTSAVYSMIDGPDGYEAKPVSKVFVMAIAAALASKAGADWRINQNRQRIIELSGKDIWTKQKEGLGL